MFIALILKLKSPFKPPFIEQKLISNVFDSYLYIGVVANGAVAVLLFTSHPGNQLFQESILIRIEMYSNFY